MVLPQGVTESYSQPIMKPAPEQRLINILAALPFFPTSREVAQIDQFLQETAAREANAKVRLQQFIEELLDRADRAEKQLQIISSCGTTPNGSLGRCSLQASKGNGHQVGAPSSRSHPTKTRSATNLATTRQRELLLLELHTTFF